jgi:hypothetical protein
VAGRGAVTSQGRRRPPVLQLVREKGSVHRPVRVRRRCLWYDSAAIIMPAAPSSLLLTKRLLSIRSLL